MLNPLADWSTDTVTTTYYLNETNLGPLQTNDTLALKQFFHSLVNMDFHVQVHSPRRASALRRITESARVIAATKAWLSSHGPDLCPQRTGLHVFSLALAAAPLPI